MGARAPSSFSSTTVLQMASRSCRSMTSCAARRLPGRSSSPLPILPCAKLAARCVKAGIESLDVKAANASILDDVVLGEGSILCGFTQMTSNIRIGRYFHANIYSYVAHDCVIGDFVTFAPGVKCNGNIHIDDHAYVGTGAILKQGTPDKPLRIGRGAVIGMGAVVTKDVAPGETVVGNPARPMPPR